MTCKSAQENLEKLNHFEVSIVWHNLYPRYIDTIWPINEVDLCLKRTIGHKQMVHRHSCGL